MQRYGQVSAPEDPAQGAILVLIWINIFTLRGIVEILFGVDLDPTGNLPTPILWCIGFALLSVTYIIIRRKKLCEKVVKEFSSETPRERLNGTVFIWLYTIGSVIAVILSAYFSKHAHDAGFTVFGYLYKFLK